MKNGDIEVIMVVSLLLFTHIRLVKVQRVGLQGSLLHKGSKTIERMVESVHYNVLSNSWNDRYSVVLNAVME